MSRALPQGFESTAEALPDSTQRYVLSLQGVSSKAELMTALAQALSLPTHFGRNWDALYDLLTDLDSDSAVILQNQPAFAQAHSSLWEPLEGVLLDAQQFLANQGVALWLLK